jgi:hypothetical protein
MRGEAQVLEELRAAVERAAGGLSEESPWAETLSVLEKELKSGQPFFFKVALASSSRSKSDVPVVSS